MSVVMMSLREAAKGVDGCPKSLKMKEKAIKHFVTVSVIVSNMYFIMTRPKLNKVYRDPDLVDDAPLEARREPDAATETSATMPTVRCTIVPLSREKAPAT